MSARIISYGQAVREATEQCMAADERVYLMGLGAPDPRGAFGTTLGLQKRFGPRRVLDMPTSENGMTGVAVGSALVGMRPIMVHLRMDFTYLALDQLANNAAKWRYMFGGKAGKVPLVVRAIIGRGWGQGAQHSQNLQSIFAHIPGLKVVMPATPYDVKGLLVSAIEDDNPVIFIEHRWLHNTLGEVPKRRFRVPLGKAEVKRRGRDVTFIATSHMTVEAVRAADILKKRGISAEVVDVRTLRPLDEAALLRSVRKTGRLIVADAAWRSGGFAAELLALAAEKAHGSLKAAPRRLTLPDIPTPTSPRLANRMYPRAIDLVNAALSMLRRKSITEREAGIVRTAGLDQFDVSFRGPF